jgi:hypothetical protein
MSEIDRREFLKYSAGIISFVSNLKKEIGSVAKIILNIDEADRLNLPDDFKDLFTLKDPTGVLPEFKQGAQNGLYIHLNMPDAAVKCGEMILGETRGIVSTLVPYIQNPHDSTLDTKASEIMRKHKKEYVRLKVDEIWWQHKTKEPPRSDLEESLYRLFDEEMELVRKLGTTDTPKYWEKRGPIHHRANEIVMKSIPKIDKVPYAQLMLKQQKRALRPVLKFLEDIEKDVEIGWIKFYEGHKDAELPKNFLDSILKAYERKRLIFFYELIEADKYSPKDGLSNYIGILDSEISKIKLKLN